MVYYASTEIVVTSFHTTLELGKAIERVRKQQHASQIQLAQMSNVGVRFVRDLEDGKPSVQFDKLMKVMEVLGIEMAFDLPPGSEER